ncbi:MAG TPA: HD domain-containing protein [Firmicutes bacterium]|jgi:putative hydrolase of HD superfamily|nr:HD domain-containing protein [Bacillota bacterium]
MVEIDKERLGKQLRFIAEIDQAKSIYRQTLLLNGSRQENDAEHSWHLAVMAALLYEYTDDPDLDVEKTIKMALLHDIVEIDAGDTFCYDPERGTDKAEREAKAAERIYNLLPMDQARQFRGLWQEFEERRTAEARFAAALDRLQPIIHNYRTNGHSWRKHNIRKEQVMERIAPIADSSRVLWEYAKHLVEEAVKKGLLQE